MTIIRNVVPPLNANCYIVADERTNNCLIVDVGGGYDEIMKTIKECKFTPVGAIFTHGHYDHALDGYKLKNAGIPVYIMEKDEELLQGRGNLARYCGVKMTPFTADGYLTEGDCRVGDVKFKTIFTPGHTAGSCCFLFGDTLLSGDCLFKGNFGRCDFPSGSIEDMKNSVFVKLYSMPDETVVYPGHGEPTTIGEEKKGNPLNEYKN